ncbi:hypothetical protein E5358_12650 [Palleniella muris]|uniref:Uncharacterized protein n=1 Tax=Palleniella muris TaxID=3038145 RepID=A0AC61QMM6_9BACT|nr:hypothetical protein [Palleniella muris]TGX80500.1 hypothetical protein E5358_12650 [Palleniella muris]
MATIKYRIDGVGWTFDTLKDAKYHVFLAYTREERKLYLRGCSIVGVKHGEDYSITHIRIDDEGNYFFSKTEKC